MIKKNGVHLRFFVKLMITLRDENQRLNFKSITVPSLSRALDLKKLFLFEISSVTTSLPIYSVAEHKNVTVRRVSLFICLFSFLVKIQSPLKLCINLHKFDL